MKQFKENLNTAALTTNYVISNGSPILKILHHDDGIWEFFGGESISEADIAVVSLEQMIVKDPSILEVADLPINFRANRESVKHAWVVNAIE